MQDITQVRILVGKQLGISEADARTPANLSPEERTRLLDYTFKYVADHPEEFTQSQVAIARQHVAAWGVDTPLVDTSFDWGMLANEMANNALKIAQAGGNVIKNAVYLGVVVLVVVYFSPQIVKAWKAYKAK